ncbi:hypothetical protein WA158_003009 [Blastocystis sp. Blastoise]
MIKEDVLFDLDSLNQAKEAVSGLDKLMKKIKLQGVLNNLDDDCIQRKSDKFSKLKHFLDNTKGKTTTIMNSSDANDTELILFTGNGPLFSLSKTIINSIPYSYIYEQSEEELRTNDGNIFLDYRGNDACIDFREQAKLLELFEFCNLPIPIELLECREKRNEKQKHYEKGDEVSLYINEKKDDTIKNYLINNNLWDDYIMKYKNGYVDYDYINDIRSMNMNYKYMKCITECMESGYFYVKKEEVKNKDISLLENEMYSVFGDQGREAVKTYLNEIPTVFVDSTIIKKKCFETPLVNWLDEKKKWKLLFSYLYYVFLFLYIYRASEHNYLASKFHRYCDNKGETVTIIKHIGKNNHMNIFGGYTDQNWESGLGHNKPYSQEFLFTLSNEHDVSPTKYDYIDSDRSLGIYCRSSYGPTFGDCHDIYISDECHSNPNSSCKASYFSERYTPQKSSLFVNTHYANSENNYKVEDYEVWGRA